MVPAALLHGPRQCGKTTLAHIVGQSHDYEYFTFDDEVVRSTAETDPAGFVADLPERVILDEVRRAPQVFSALKLAIDRRRVPGRFILTGSTNVLLLPTLADSLAGRMERVRLYPLSQCELAEQRSRFLDALFEQGFSVGTYDRLGADLAARVVAGGYPTVLARSTDAARARWYREYLEVKASATVTSRDFHGLRHLKEATGARFAGGVVLYDGETCAPFGDGLYAVPLRRLWETV